VAAGGTRVATAYVEVAADTRGLSDQIKDAITKAGADLKPVGAQLGKDLSTGIREGVTRDGGGSPSGGGGNVSGGLGKQIQADIVKTLDPKKAGQQIGKDLSTGLRTGVTQGSGGGGVGKQIQQDITKSVDAKKTGEQIGKDISTGVQDSMRKDTKGGAGKQIQDSIKDKVDAKKTGKDIGKDVGEGVKDELDVTLKEALQPARDWARNVKDEIRKGDIKGAVSDVGDVIANVTASISHAGGPSVVGEFGDNLATQMDNVAGTVQTVVDNLKNVRDSVAAIRSGDLSGIQGLADIARGIGQSGMADVLEKVQTHAGGFLDTYRDTHKELTETIDTLKTMGLGAGAAGALATFAPPAAAAAATFMIGTPLEKKVGEKVPIIGDIDKNLWLTQWARDTLGISEPAAPPPTATEAPPEGFTGGGGSFDLPSKTRPRLGPYDVPTGAERQAQIQAAVAAPSAAGSAQIGHATEEIATASIMVGSANLAGVSIPTAVQTVIAAPSGSASSGTVPSGPINYKALYGPPSRQTGGPINQDEVSKLHAGEHVLTADDVNAIGGQDAVTGARQQLQAGKNGGQDMLSAMRTAGFVPAAAGQQTIAGTSALAGLFNLGNQAVGGVIDAAAQAGQMAASAAVSAGTMGAGAAAGPAAGMGIQIGAQEAKRAVSYGFQLASIWTDALMEQAFPFGAPRWLGYDYTKFMPNINVGTLATTTTEKAIQAAMGGGQGQPGQQPGGPVAPQQMPGAYQGQGPTPQFGTPTPAKPPDMPPPGLAPAGQASSLQAGIAAGIRAAAPSVAPTPPPPQSTSPAPQPPPQPQQQGGLLGGLLPFDEGGWMMPGQPGINTTNRPELVLSPQQLDAATQGGGGWGRGDTYHITAVDADDVARQIDARKKLAMMQYSGRP
jgi:hypothetical protein